MVLSNAILIWAYLYTGHAIIDKKVPWRSEYSQMNFFVVIVFLVVTTMEIFA